MTPSGPSGESSPMKSFAENEMDTFEVFYDRKALDSLDTTTKVLLPREHSSIIELSGAKRVVKRMRVLEVGYILYHPDTGGNLFQFMENDITKR